MNISQGGMFIKTEEIKPVGTVLSFEFSLSDNFKLIQGLGEVMWVREKTISPEQPRGMGIKFHDIDAKSRELIRTMIDRHLSEGGKPFDLNAGLANVEKEFAALFSVSETAGQIAQLPGTPAEVHLDPLSETAELPPLPEPLPPQKVGTIEDEAVQHEPTLAAKLEPEKPEYSDEPKTRPWLPILAMVVALGGGGSYLYFFTDLPKKYLSKVSMPKISLSALKSKIGLGEKRPPLQTAPQPVSMAPTAEPTSVATSIPTIAPTFAPKATATPVPTVAPTEAPTPVPTIAPTPEAQVEPEMGLHLVTVTWKKMPEKTMVTLTTDTTLTDDSYEAVRLEGAAPREVIKLLGAASGYKKAKLLINSPEVTQARFGFHASENGKEIHVVFDLVDPQVKIGEIEAQGKRLTIEFQNLE